MLSNVDIKYFKLAVNGPYSESDVDIAVKCPICGDSKKRKSSKRLHLYKKGDVTLVHCFNGDCELNSQRSLLNFLKLYHPDLVSNYKNENFGNILRDFVFDDNKKEELSFNIPSFLNSDDIKNLKITENPENSKNTEINSTSKLNNEKTKFNLNILTLPENVVQKNTLKCQAYLKNIRKLDPERIRNNFGDFLQGLSSFLYNGKYYNIKDFIIIPIYYEDKFTGFYGRSMNEKKFLNLSLNKGFNIWNFFNINYSEPVYIFESIMDALSFSQMFNINNVIALNTSVISNEALQYLKYPIFCLDNDKVGINQMIKYNKVPNSEFIIYPENLKHKDFNEMLCNDFKIDLKFMGGFRALVELKKLL